MSVDYYYGYIIKGKSEDIAEFVKKHISDGYFRIYSLGIDYPENLDYENHYDPQQIINEGITEIEIIVLIVKRMHFTNQFIEQDIYWAIVNQYPNLEISTKYLGDFPHD